MQVLEKHWKSCCSGCCGCVCLSGCCLSGCCWSDDWFRIWNHATAVHIRAVAVLPCDWSWHDDVALDRAQSPLGFAALCAGGAVAGERENGVTDLSREPEGGGVGDGKHHADGGEVSELHVFVLFLEMGLCSWFRWMMQGCNCVC
jgi:hypothetical protein